MPGAEAGYAALEEEDLLPKDEESHHQLLTDLMGRFQAAENARQPFDDRWTRYYRLYRSWVQKKKGDWRSKVFVPICFWVVETITPRLVAQLPEPLVHPVEESDEAAAATMEGVLRWAFDHPEAHTFEELVKGYKSALRYGTGILKTFHKQKIRKKRVRQPAFDTLTIPETREVADPDRPGEPLRDPDDNPVIESVDRPIQMPRMDQQGQPVYETSKVDYTVYDGPACAWVSNFNFWVAPDATDLDDARYVIQRVFTDWKHIKDLEAKGVYTLPEWMGEQDLWGGEADPQAKLLGEVGLQGAMEPGSDPSRQVVELLEFWEDERCYTVLNRRVVIRGQENPFDHGEKPYIRILDHVVEGEFWGIGEIEPLEGLQDFRNQLTNLRIDNLKLILNRMFAVDVSKLADLRELTSRPGGIIRFNSMQGSADSVFHPLELGDVTGSAYVEGEETDKLVEKVSGVSAYTAGTDSPTLNDTATGVAIIQEQGATRFGLKSRLAEMTGLRRLARHYGSILQQFTDEERKIRVSGERGKWDWAAITPEGLFGGLDYDIDLASSTQTESMRQQMSLSLLRELWDKLPTDMVQDPATGQTVPVPGTGGQAALIEDVLRAFNRKDIDRYLSPQQEQLPQDPAAQAGIVPGEDLMSAIGQVPTQLPEAA